MDILTNIYTYINTEDSQATYYKLAEFVLENIKRLPNMPISQFAEETFVSKATITRYTQFLGFESYQEFKSYFAVLSNTSWQSFLKLSSSEIVQAKDSPKEFFEQNSQKVINSIKDTTQTLDLAEVDNLILSVQTAKKVAFLGYRDSNIIAKDIQLGCLLAGKKIEIAESKKKFFDILERFTSDDLIVILSNYGNFFVHYQHFYDMLLTKNIPLILVTQNHMSMESFRFQQTIYLSSKRQLDINNYPLRIFSEYFIQRIILQHK